MKYFFEDKNYPGGDFITGYDIKDDRINLHFAFEEKDHSIEYSKEKVYLLNDKMRSQVENNELENKYKNKNRQLTWWKFYNMWFAYFSIYNANKASSNGYRIAHSVLFLFFVLFLGLNIKDKIKNKERLDEIRKYKYFIENQELINYEIIKRHLENNNSNIPDITDAPLITINDIDDMTLIELKETVELIKQNYGEELEQSEELQLLKKGTI